MKGYDLIVIGLGGHGSSILFHAAKRGLRVLGIEQYDVGHQFGSSHGLHRMFRAAYADGQFYVPLLLRAAELWSDLERTTSNRLLHRVGVLLGSTEQSGIVDAEYRCARAFEIRHDVLTAIEINTRYPAFAISSDMIGLLQPDAGYVMSEQTIMAHMLTAIGNGAHVVTRCTALSLRERTGHVEVETSMGTFEAGQVAVATGAFIGRLLPQLAHLHRVSRRVQGFFRADRARACPCFIFSNDHIGIYGFPEHGTHGIKVGRDGHLRETGDPYELRRETSSADEDCLREGIQEFLSDGNASLQRMQSCIVSETPDKSFIIDTLSEMPHVHIVSMCSGHGFKFSTVTGEIVADRVQGRTDRFDLTPFKISRFEQRGTLNGHSLSLE